jgi:hypothetical protein
LLNQVDDGIEIGVSTEDTSEWSRDRLRGKLVRVSHDSTRVGDTVRAFATVTLRSG